MEIYRDRARNTKMKDLGSSILDRMVHHNLLCDAEGREDEKMSMNEVTGNLFVFQFGGSDTTFHTSINILSFLAAH